MGEVHCCRPLYDPSCAIVRLKELTIDYPSTLREALIRKHLFDAGFELMIARGPAARNDVMYVAGCLFRAVGFITLTLYAINQRYFINEKGALDETREFPLKPNGLHDELTAVLANIGSDPPALSDSLARAEAAYARLEQFCAAHVPAAIVPVPSPR